MYKAKLCGFAIACMVGFASISPISAFATETNTESVTLSDKNDQDEKKAAFEKKLKLARKNWYSLTEQQRAEVYALVENELKDEIRILEKLVELKVMEKEDVAYLKARMMAHFNEMKDNGDFPLFKQRREKSRK
jgi:hypothetical protein